MMTMLNPPFPRPACCWRAWLQRLGVQYRDTRGATRRWQLAIHSLGGGRDSRRFILGGAVAHPT